jgi:hypothetical protein
MLINYIWLMKKLLLIIAICIAGLLNATNINAQAFISYDVNGKPFNITEDQFISFAAYRTSDEKNVCKYLTATVSGTHGIEYTIDIDLNIALNAMPTVGSYKLAENISFLKKVPLGYLKLVKREGEDYKFYETEKNAKGNITITKVDGDWIEGTFEGEVIPQYPIKNKNPLKITNGKFKYQVTQQE